MEKFIIIEILDAECFNDPKCRVYQDVNGNPIKFESIEHVKIEGLLSRLPKFMGFKQVTEIIELPDDELEEY
jgi:hypothetical protein